MFLLQSQTQHLDFVDMLLMTFKGFALLIVYEESEVFVSWINITSHSIQAQISQFIDFTIKGLVLLYLKWWVIDK